MILIFYLLIYGTLPCEYGYKFLAWARMFYGNLLIFGFEKGLLDFDIRLFNLWDTTLRIWI